jgi:hypothetical protein
VNSRQEQGGSVSRSEYHTLAQAVGVGLSEGDVLHALMRALKAANPRFDAESFHTAVMRAYLEDQGERHAQTHFGM